VSAARRMVDEALFQDGKMFDGSSIAGWKGIEESDMVLMPEAGDRGHGPVHRREHLIVRCDILEPRPCRATSATPRSVAKRAEAYLKSTGIADTAFFGPEPEFFVLDDVRWGADMSGAFYKVDSDEADWNSERVFEDGNMGHRPGVKGGYFPVPPVDSLNDLRGGHVPGDGRDGRAGRGASPRGRHRRPVRDRHPLHTLVQRADWNQILKYCVHNVAHAYGKTATFMPKPLVGDNGNGMHVHQSLARTGRTSSPATSTAACPRPRSTTSAASSSTPAR
jgi:glutamine synthetase